ncbi:hypothetical protein MTO96_047399 [Rhipicephalus appendiculatus]
MEKAREDEERERLALEKETARRKEEAAAQERELERLRLELQILRVKRAGGQGYGIDSLQRRIAIFSDKRYQQAVLSTQRLGRIGLAARQARFYGHLSTKRRIRIDDNIIDGCLYEELAEPRRL